MAAIRGWFRANKPGIIGAIVILAIEWVVFLAAIAL